MTKVKTNYRPMHLFPIPRDFYLLEKGQFYCYVQHRADGTPFYVGKGHDLRYRNPHNVWHERAVRADGEANISTMLLPCSSEQEAFEYEKELIFLLRCQGYKLTNMTDGGEGPVGYKHTLEAREKIRRTSTGRPWTPEFRQRFSKMTTGHPYYPVTDPIKRANQTETRRGVKNTEEHNAKISASKMGHTVTEETAAKIGTANATIAHAKRNKTIIDTPWGPMGLHDAFVKSGFTEKCFFGRYNRKFPMEKLFYAGHLYNTGDKQRGKTRPKEVGEAISAAKWAKFLERNNTTLIETPWDPMGAYDASIKLGVKWGAFEYRLKKQTPAEELFDKVNYRASAII